MLLVVASLGSLIVAQGPVPLDKVLDQPAAVSLGERYVGVAPGPEAKNPLPRPRPQPTHLVWTGFQKSPVGAGRVFLQTTAPVEYQLVPAAKGGRTVGVVLRNCRIHMRNNARRMDTRFFSTAVEEVTARQRRKDVELRIQLTGAAPATPRVEPGPDGTHFLVLEFGGPDAPAAHASRADVPGPAGK